MPKDYTATKLTDIMIRINIPAEKNDKTGMKYYAATMKCCAKAKNGIMQAPIALEETYLGAAKSVPWTNKEIWQAINGAPLNTIFANAIKSLYLQGLDEDITQK